MAGKIVNKSELAAIIGKTTKTLTVWQAEGMPFVESAAVGLENSYNTASVIAWMIRRETKGGLDLDVERAKLAQEQAESVRRKNALAAGDVIPKKAAIAVVQRAAYSLRQAIVTSGMSHEDKQNCLKRIQELRDVDFEKIDPDADEEPEGDA